MDVLHTLAATSLVQVCSLVHGSSEHRDPAQERFEHPELIFTLEDRWGVRCGRGDAIAHPGTLVLGNQGEYYSCRHFTRVAKDRTVCVSFVGLIGPEGGSLSEWLGQLSRPLFDNLTVPLTREFRWYLRQLLKEITIRTPGFQLKVDGLSSSLLVDVVRLLRAQGRTLERGNGSTQRTTEALGRARAYMETNFADDLELLTLAGIAELSPFHFSRLFKQFSGYSPHQYLLRARLDHAAELLRDTRMSILEVTLSVGFQDATHFARSFRRYTGLTPTAYRRRKPQD